MRINPISNYDDVSSMSKSGLNNLNRVESENEDEEDKVNSET